MRFNFFNINFFFNSEISSSLDLRIFIWDCELLEYSFTFSFSLNNIWSLLANDFHRLSALFYPSLSLLITSINVSILLFSIASSFSCYGFQNFENTIILLVISFVDKGVTLYLRMGVFPNRILIFQNRNLGVTPKSGFKLYHLQFSAVYPTFWNP